MYILRDPLVYFYQVHCVTRAFTKEKVKFNIFNFKGFLSLLKIMTVTHYLYQKQREGERILFPFHKESNQHSWKEMEKFSTSFLTFIKLALTMTALLFSSGVHAKKNLYSYLEINSISGNLACCYIDLLIENKFLQPAN